MLLDILMRAWEILISPWLQEVSLWMVLPLIVLLVFINIYFGRHETEKLGWSTAFSNGISLLWVCVLLFRFLFDKYSMAELFGAALPSFITVSILSLWVLLLFFINFLHLAPKHFAFVLSSPWTVYIIAYVVISVIVGGFPFDLLTLVGSLLVFFLLLGAGGLVMYLIPPSPAVKAAKKRK